MFKVLEPFRNEVVVDEPSKDNAIAFLSVIYPRYRGPQVTTQNSGYDRPPPVANGWGIIHPILGNDPTTTG
jgi:hypothetical protein